MHDIEIHGLNPARAEAMQRKIFDLFDWPDLIVTTVDGAIRDRTGKSHPFLRVFSGEDTGVLVAYLAGLDMDIEVVRLERFMAAKRVP